MLFSGGQGQFPGNQHWIGGGRSNGCGIHKGEILNNCFLPVYVEFSQRVLSTIVDSLFFFMSISRGAAISTNSLSQPCPE